jgi:alpha-galactosidase
VFDEKFSFASARAALVEVKENQKYWYGDFYPLTPCGLGPGALIAWQLHRSDLNAGIVLAFRRSECPYPVLQTGLHGLSRNSSYVVDIFEEGSMRRRRTLSGKQLMSDLELRMSKCGTSLMLRYKARQ